MIPLKDDNPIRITPYVVFALIGANAAVFLFQVLQGPEFSTMTISLGIIPYEITHFTSIRPEGMLNPAFTPLTSMFTHGGFIHILSNMWFLWIFGNNIEENTGHIKFVLFYIICGWAATATHVVFNPESTVPTVGASGAIAGVLGAYLVQYPTARVNTLVLLFPFFIDVIKIPAIFFLGFWFILQLLYSTGGGGVAWFAHIGGFIAGMLLIKTFEKNKRRPRPIVVQP